MGAKIIGVSIGLTIASMLDFIICLSASWHQTVFAAGGVPAIRIINSILRIQITACGPGMAAGWIAQKYDPSICAHNSGYDLSDFSTTACSGLSITFFPTICEATHRAYVMGVIVLITSITNMVLESVGVALAIQYITGKLKKQYRQLWVILLVIGAFLQTASLVVYYILAMAELDSMQSRIPGISPGTMGGSMPGYIFMWVGVILEIVAIMLAQMAKTSQEEVYAEQRANDKFNAEVQMYQNAVSGANPGASSYPQGMSQPMQPQGGFAQPPPQQAGFAQPPPQQAGFAPPPPQQGGFGMGPAPPMSGGFGGPPPPGPQIHVVFSQGGPPQQQFGGGPPRPGW